MNEPEPTIASIIAEIDAAREAYRAANGFGATVQESLQAADRLADTLEAISFKVKMSGVLNEGES